MPDPYQPVRPGEKVRFSASVWNSMVAVARAEKEGLGLAGPPIGDVFRQSGIIKVQNDTGLDLPRFSVVGLDAPVFLPSDSEDAFAREVVFRGVVPTSEHAGKFAILLDPIPNQEGRLGRAWVDGVCQARVYLAAADHTCCDVDPGQTGSLISSDTGTAQILWREGGDEYGYEYGYYEGEQWAIIRFGAGCDVQGGANSLGRCDCPEDSYEVDAICGKCRKLPKYWYLTISTASDDPYNDPCEGTGCSGIEGTRIKLSHDDQYYEAGCSWLGQGGNCIFAELIVGTTYAELIIYDANDCRLATLQKAMSGFNCCGTNSGWEQIGETDACVVEVTLEPHPCTCCPPVADCPPDGEPICSSSPCCVAPNNCTINVDVSDLVSPPGADPDESCGGMSGAYAFDWVEDCTWEFHGEPSGLGLPTYVDGTLTLSGSTWEMTLLGADGQSAVFRLEDWDCQLSVALAFDDAGSSCPATSPVPTASFLLGGL